ncbi:MAG: hypothetical protein HZB63_04210, partial [Deltaproteobacteria bacterium]|nr:hypothetical protein [Deltaproteobacteria bacterium]
ATINATTGVLTGGTVTANTSAVIGASYASGGVTKTATATVTIVDVPATTGTVTVYPADDAENVPRNTVITATVGGSTDIRTIFNGNSFTLRPEGDSTDSSVGASGPLAASVCVSGGIVQGVFTYNTTNTTGTFTPNCELGEEKTYDAAIATGAGSPLSASVRWKFKTAEEGPDSDDDGSPDSEDDDPHDGKKASRHGSKGNGKIHVDVSDNTGASIKAAVAMSDDNSRLNQAGKPATFMFHDGLVAYNVAGIAPGSTVTVKITFPSGVPAGSKIYQVDANGFHEIPGAVINGNIVTMTLTDGGTGDGDGQANGVIVDPVGVAAPVSGSGSVDLSTGGSSGGGCAVAGRSGPGWGLREIAGAYGFLILAVLGLALRGRLKRREK